MKLWPIFPILLLTQQSVVLGQGAAESLKKGDSALNDGLWEVAELHFRDSLADHTLTAELKSQVMVRLAEALIHEGNLSEALDLLGQSVAAVHPEASFWKAQALAGQLNFNEAIAIFSQILAKSDSPHLIEAGLTQASLQLALGQQDAALATLANLIPEADAATVVKIHLYQVEIFIDLGRTEDARQAMPAKASIAAADRPVAEFLEAQLQLKEGHPDVAEAGFQLLINKSLTGHQGLPLLRYHAAAIGLADAIQAQGDPEVAAKSLLDFIQDNPDSPLLDAMFSRILQWLPEKPTATDPILERIDQWITDPNLRFPPILRPTSVSLTPGASDTTAVSAWPFSTESVEQKDLLAYSLYTSAVGLHRIATPKAQADSRSLLNRLRVEAPDHFLTNRALYQLARWNLDEGKVDLAFPILDTLRDTAKSPALKGQSAFLEARVSYQNGDPAKAARLFEEAAKSLTGSDARNARLHEAISRIRSGVANGTTLIQLQGNPPDKELEADLELERALATTPPDAARTALDGFLTRFPDHPRAAEARLAAAEAALASTTPDLSFATAQLDTLAAAPEKADKLPPARIALARLRIADLSNDSAATTAVAQSIIDSYPTQPEAAEAKFTLGRKLFQAGNYNPARLLLEDLAAKGTDPNRAQAALLLAARSAALGGTEASKKEALILFDNAIKSAGPLTSIANLEKSRLLIDMSRPDEAARFLGEWTVKLAADDPLRLPAGLLLGEALSDRGNSDPASLAEALAVYDKLLAQAESHPALLNRLQYLRGRTLELMPDEKDPTKKREKQAFQAYHSVLETTTPPAEWEYFELCGFRALELLIKAERWQAAINVAKQIASFKGPGAEDAAARAREIQLKQMLWED
ncbi:MAG: tetratricopeptide repeat protein [Luteolibacter sp.]|uniref:tetratricopeptide repeat protein n=1 Tax=Luteolibacter sp. TaxID=1962973 RepID=UPI0032640872